MSNAVNAENVNRKSSYKGKIVFCIILLLSILLIELVFAYNYLNYIQTAQLSGTAFIDFAFSTMNPFKNIVLPLNLQTLGQMFSCVGSVWYINLVFFLSLFLIIRKGSNFSGMEYGSARWMTEKEKKEFKTDRTTGVIPIADNVFINPEHNSLNNLNEIVLGGAGSGKSFTKLTPDIMYQFGSYVITDVKGDLFKFLYKILSMNDYKIRVLNLDNLKYSNSFNPILYCETDTDIDKLVNTFVINSRREGANAGEGFWEDTLSMLLFAAIRYITQTPSEEKTFYRCLCLAASIKLVNGEVSPYCEIESIMTKLEQEDEFSSAVLNWKLVKQAPAETLQSVIISLTSRLRLWANEDLRILTHTDEMNFDGLAEEKTAIFLIVPEGDSTYNCVSSMFISTAVQRLKSIAKNKYNGSLPHLVSFELDEFANTGILPKWAEVVSTIRSQNIRAMMVLQDLQQLKKNYDKSEKTIMSNCSIFNYLGTSEEDTNKMISERLGKTTIKGKDTSYQNSGGITGRDNISERGLGRELMTKDEIGNKDKSKSIVFLDNHYPLYATKFKTAEHPLYPYLGFNRGKAAENNTDIVAVYEELYEQHRQGYFDSLKTEKEKIDLFSDTDIGDVREHTLNNGEDETTTPEAPESENGEKTVTDEKAIQEEFERQFLNDLKSISK